MNKEHLQGDAAREALAYLCNHAAGEGGWRPFSKRLLATGRVVVLPEPEPMCEKAILAVLAPAADFGDVSTRARKMHAASLCPCAATALLRRWMAADGKEHWDVYADTRAFLGQTAAQCPGPISVLAHASDACRLDGRCCTCIHGQTRAHAITEGR